MGWRARHRPLLPEHLKGRGRLGVLEDPRPCIRQGAPCPFGATARLAPARTGFDPVCIGFLLRCLVEVAEEGQQRVAGGLRQASEGFQLTVVSDLSTHRLASSMVFLEDRLPGLLLRNNSKGVPSHRRSVLLK